MAGTLVIDTLTDGSGNTASATAAIRGSAKAWVCFNGSTGAIRASYNVSSVTRNGTGDYTANFTTALVDGNYSWAGSVKDLNDDSSIGVLASRLSDTTTASALRFVATFNGALYDPNTAQLAVFR